MGGKEVEVRDDAKSMKKKKETQIRRKFES